MRDWMFLLAALAAGCGSSRPAVKNAMSDDPELLGACVPENGEFAPRYCEKTADGTWTVPDGEPQGHELRQAQQLFQDGHDEPAVKLLAIVIDGGKAGPCGLQVARWYRARAFFRLDRYRQAFLDFGQIVRDGPENPYYDQVGAWLAKLEPHVGRETIIACQANYVHPTGVETLEGRDSHWVPYTPADPKPEY